MYSKLLDIYEAKFWALRRAKSIIAYYHLLADFNEIKAELELHNQEVNNEIHTLQS